MKPTCTILTYCSDPALLYGTTLTFKTLRVGFPTARVMVFDNGSHPDAKPHIERAAKDAGCEYKEMPRHDYIDYFRWLFMQQEMIDSLVIIDPDLIFWDEVENWSFNPALMAGRLMPRMARLGWYSVPNVETVPRLHTSHLWVPDVPKLRAAIMEIKQFNFDPFSQRSTAIDGKFYFWDTLAMLYNAMPERMYTFTDCELDHYDHLFCGTHFPLARLGLSEGFLTAHEAAVKGDLMNLRGIWRDQQQFFESSPVSKPLEQIAQSASDTRGHLLKFSEALSETPDAPRLPHLSQESP